MTNWIVSDTWRYIEQSMDAQKNEFCWIEKLVFYSNTIHFTVCKQMIDIAFNYECKIAIIETI